MRARRAKPDRRGTLRLAEGEYAKVDEIWWMHPPGGQTTAVAHVTEHEDGTVTAEFEQLGKQYRIDRDIWKPD
jgi:hypothetical protein